MFFLEPRNEFDVCILGVSYYDHCLVYDIDMVFMVYMRLLGLSFEDVEQWFEYNVMRGLEESSAPIFISKNIDLNQG